MEVIDYIEQRQISGDLRETLLSYAGDDLESLKRVLIETNPSANFLRDCLRLAREIAARDKKVLAEVFSSNQIKPLLESSELSPKDKQKQIKEKLTELRHPEVARIKQQVRHAQMSLIRKHGVAIELPLNLEGTTLSIKFEARNIEEIANAAEALKNLAIDPQCDELFSLILGK
jgi:hypothetical protein